jgi:hypothetical protein
MTDASPKSSPDPSPSPSPSPNPGPGPGPEASPTVGPPTAPGNTPTGHHINTDRPCARCGFNLFGQPIIREAHYGLIAARCPECSQIAALQEYPALGRWADRWARTLAALWVVVLFVAAGTQFGPTFGMLLAGVEIASEDFGESIATAFDESTRLSQGPIPGRSGMLGGWTDVDTEWWREHGNALIESKGGLTAVINHRFAWLLAPINIGSLAAGIFWSVCLLGARRRSVMIPAMLPLVIAVVIAWLAQSNRMTGTSVKAHDISVETIKRLVLPLLGGTAMMSVLLGVSQGRRLARLVVRLSLPPRMRSSLAILWTRDGLPPPATAAV